MVGGEDVPSQDPIWNISSMLFTVIDDVGLRRDKTGEEGQVI